MVTFLPLKQAIENEEIFLNFRCLNANLIPYSLCKCEQIIEKSFWTGPFNLS